MVNLCIIDNPFMRQLNGDPLYNDVFLSNVAKFSKSSHRT